MHRAALDSQCSVLFSEKLLPNIALKVKPETLGKTET